jgi:hypothetical protein
MHSSNDFRFVCIVILICLIDIHMKCQNNFYIRTMPFLHYPSKISFLTQPRWCSYCKRLTESDFYYNTLLVGIPLPKLDELPLILELDYRSESRSIKYFTFTFRIKVYNEPNDFETARHECIHILFKIKLNNSSKLAKWLLM